MLPEQSELGLHSRNSVVQRIERSGWIGVLILTLKRHKTTSFGGIALATHQCISVASSSTASATWSASPHSPATSRVSFFVVVNRRPDLSKRQHLEHEFFPQL